MSQSCHTLVLFGHTVEAILCRVEQDSNWKGNVAELKIAAAAADLGIPVLQPMTEHGRYDLEFELAGELKRVQCKWGAVKDGIVQVRVGGSYHSPTRGYVLSTYDSSEI